MAIYRHVRNKDDLMDAVLDHAASMVELPSSDLGWREGLEALARSIRATMLRHRAVAARIIDRPTLGPASLAIGEFGMGVLREAGFSDEVAEHGLNLVVVYALGFVALEVPRLADASTALDESEVRRRYDELPAGEYPHTTAVRPRPHGIVSDEQFDFGLQCLLDGIAARRPSG